MSAGPPVGTARVVLRYSLLQVPGAIVVGGLLFGFHELGWLSSQLAWSLLGLWLVKEVAVFPLVRPAYENAPSALVGAERLVGSAGIAEDDLRPSGWVLIGAERWKAEALEDAGISSGDAVVVDSVRDLTVCVSRSGSAAP